MGLIRKRGRIWYSDYYDANHKRIRKPLSTDRRIAENKLAVLVAGRDANRYAHAQTRIGWPEFREKYLDYSNGSKKGSTPQRDLAAIRALEKFFLPSKLEQINPEVLDRWKAHRRSEGRGQATISRDVKAIKAMMHKAEDWGYIAKQNWRSVKVPKSTQKRLLFYTPKELAHLFKKCKIEYPELSRNEVPHDWVTIAMLGARAGLRRGEILHLAWPDVDLEAGILSVTPKTCDCHDCLTYGKLWEPKDYEKRHIPLPGDLITHLRGLPRASAWVLGQRPASGTVTSYFRRISRRAGLKGNVHTLRHTYASHLVQNGVDLYTVSKLLGHASTTQTEVYAHLAPKTLRDAVQKLPSLT